MQAPFVVCIKQGRKYGPEYVNRLEAMLERHTTRPYHFCVLTDDSEGVASRLVYPLAIDEVGWWTKLALFKPHNGLEGRRVIYLDLDTVITGNVDWLFDFEGDFAIVSDWWSETYNSSVMSIKPGFGEYIWENRARATDFWGDQAYITDEIRTRDEERAKVHVWQMLAPGQVGSYKADKLEDGPWGFSLVCFHGEPKPHQLTTGWVPTRWR